GSAQASLRTGQRADCREASPARQADHVQQHGGADPALRADHAQPWVRDPARRSVRLDRELQRRARYYLVADGGEFAWRVRTRPPSFIHFAIFPHIIKDHLLADVVAVLGSLNIIAAELDR